MGSLGFGPPGKFTASCALGAIGSLAFGCGTAARREPPPTPANDAEPSAEPAPTTDHPLGLVDGATWTFRGTWTHWDEASGQDVTTPMTWTTTIVSSEEKPGPPPVTVWKIRGWPGDAPSAERASATMTLIVPAHGVVRFSDDPSGAWLSLPIKEGDRTCPDPQDSEYCWTVETAGSGFDVVLRTRPDVTLYHVEPGRGITHFEYHHNGTTDDVVLDRVD